MVVVVLDSHKDLVGSQMAKNEIIFFFFRGKETHDFELVIFLSITSEVFDGVHNHIFFVIGRVAYLPSVEHTFQNVRNIRFIEHAVEFQDFLILVVQRAVAEAIHK